MNTSKLFPKYILALLVLLTPLYTTHADVIMEGTHFVDRCVRITNIEELDEEIIFLGFIQGPVIEGRYEAYRIKNNQCFKKGYKFNTLDLYFAPASEFPDFDIENLAITTEQRESSGVKYDENGESYHPLYDYYKPTGFQLLKSSMPAGPTRADDKTAPHIKEYIDYVFLEKDMGYGARLFKAQQIFEYSDGRIRTEAFPIPTSAPHVPEPEEVLLFPDMEADSPEAISAAYLKSKNIISGFPDGEFKGDKPVNRAELAKMLLLTKGIVIEEQTNNGRFSDVSKGAWYEKYVMKAAELGIINGHPDGSFHPEAPVNTAEFLKMAAHAFGLYAGVDNCLDDYTNSICNYKDVPEDAWFAKYVGINRVYKLFPKREWFYLEPAKELTRNEVVVALDKLF